MKKRLLPYLSLGVLLGALVIGLSALMDFVLHLNRPFAMTSMLLGIGLLTLGVLFVTRGGPKRLSDKIDSPYNEAARALYSSQSPYQKEIDGSDITSKPKQPFFTLPTVGIILSVGGAISLIVGVIFYLIP